MAQFQRRARPLLFLGGLGVSGLCLYFAFRHIDFDAFVEEFKTIDPFWVVVALLLANLHNFVLAFRWKFILSHLGKVNYWTAFWSLRLSFFFNASLPARLGEPFRVWYINRVAHISPARTLGAMGADRFQDFVTLCGLVYWSALVLGMRGTLPPTSTILGATFAVVVLIFILAKLPKESRFRWLNSLFQLRTRIFEGIASLKSFRVMRWTLPISILGWIIEAAILVAFSYALHDPFSIFRAFMVVAAVNVAISIPSSPGHIGTFQLGAITMLVFLNVPRAEAATIAICYHLVQLIPTILIGAYGYYFHFLRLPKNQEIPTMDVLEKMEEKIELESEAQSSTRRRRR